MNDDMEDFRRQLKSGKIQKAYKNVFDILSDVGSKLRNVDSRNLATSAIYPGYLDMTYLPVTTTALKDKGLKIAIVFNYQPFQFEIWLSATNKRIRMETIEAMSKSTVSKYPVAYENEDAILVVPVDEIKDYEKRDKVVDILVKKCVLFVEDIETSIQEMEIDHARKR